MKCFLVICVFCSSMIDAKSQQFDNHWRLGYHYSPNDTTFGGTVIDFNFSPPNIYYLPDEMSFLETNASMCDSLGGLIFYTNGIKVSNREHNIMPNGFGLNPGSLATEYEPHGYHLQQGALILPFPSEGLKYYIIHTDYKLSTGDLSAHSPHLYYTVVDMSLDNDRGDVVQKNLILMTDTLSLGKLTCVRHGNGRDWWLLVHEFSSKSYYRFLITPDGIQSLEKGSTSFSIPNEGLGQSCFSPDGNFFARINSWLMKG